MREAQVSSPVLKLARAFAHIEQTHGGTERVGNDGALADGNLEGFDEDGAALLGVTLDGFSDVIHEVMDFNVVRDVGAVVEDDLGVGIGHAEADGVAVLPKALEAKGVFVELCRGGHVGDADHDAVYFAEHW